MRFKIRAIDFIECPVCGEVQAVESELNIPERVESGFSRFNHKCCDCEETLVITCNVLIDMRAAASN